jgi:hypothetical protein
MERKLIKTGLDPSEEFDAWIGKWQQLSIDLNLLARSMGNRDLYPFVLTPRIIDKLEFVHTAITLEVNSV